MDFDYSSINHINNIIKEVSPFNLQIINNNENIMKKKINNQNKNLTTSLNNINNNDLLNQKININENLNQSIFHDENKKSINYTKNKELKIKKINKKSSNKYIVLNNSIFQKELNLLTQKFGEMSLFKNNIIPIEEENINKHEKNNHNNFPCHNNYISIRKAFADISNYNYPKKTNNNNKKQFKAKMPKNFEIHKRKINIILFNDLVHKENNKSIQKIKMQGGCCCKRYKISKIN